jgi:hypothetical protein
MRRFWVISVLLLWCAAQAIPAEPADVAGPLRFIPKGGKPLANVTRGGGNGATILFVSPERTGRTTQSQPTVFFFLQGQPKADVIVTITREGDVDAILTKDIPITGEGVHPLKLADLNLNLKPGEKYKWVVGIRPAGRAMTQKDPHHVSWIEYEPAPPALAATLQRQSSKAERARVYFEESIWCDGLACIYDVLDARQTTKPEDARRLRKQLVRVFEEVNLPEVAEFEAKQLEQ